MQTKVQRKSWASLAAKAMTATLLGSAMSLLTAGSALADNPYGANYFPNVPLTTQDGKSVMFYDDLIKGKSVAINVIYTSCKDECPLETAKLAQLAQIFGDKMGKDIFFYSISIDPKSDTPEVLKKFSKSFKTGPGWEFLTGTEADIKVLVKKLGLSRNSDKANKDGHTASLMVGNEPTGQWMRNSALDNPIFLAASMGSFLGWRDDPAKRTSYAQATPINLETGQQMFNSRCSACHTIGGGDKIGPDLAGVTQRRDREWVARYLNSADKMRVEGDPIALALSARYSAVRMPDQRLGGSDLKDILSYLELKSDVPGAGKTVAAKQAAPKQAPHKH